MAMASHRYSEIHQFVELSQAVGYAIPDHIGDFTFAELAERIRHEHPSLRWIFVVCSLCLSVILDCSFIAIAVAGCLST